MTDPRDPRDWDLEYDGAAPPLPKKMRRKIGDVTSLTVDWTNRVKRLVPQGAHLLWLEPRIERSDTESPPKAFAGVLRILHQEVEGSFFTSGSGDLYACSSDWINDFPQKLSEAADDRARLELLQFPRENYRYYLRLESLWITDREKEVLLGFDTYRFDDESHGWQRRQPITLRVDNGADRKKRRAANGMHPVFNSLDTLVGRIRMTHVSEMARHATIVIHAVPGVGTPSDQTAWETALKDSGWTVKVTSDVIPILPEHIPSGGWTRYALKSYHRDHIDAVPPKLPPAAWRYHLLVVSDLQMGAEDEEGPNGVMYDVGDPWRNEPPREGAAIAAKRKSKWPVSAQEKGAEPEESELQSRPELLCRTALHELGHMQGLYHNPGHQGIMQPTEFIDVLSPLDFRHSPIDAFRLWHLPDLWVMPGGVPFGYRYKAAAVDVLDLIPESPGLKLSMKPMTMVAGGEPEDLVLTLHNASSRAVLCPNSRHVEPRYGRLGALLRTPAGSWEEIWSVRFPRRVGGLGSTSLLSGETIVFRVSWDYKPRALRQGGLHQLHAHLSWVVDYPTSGGERIYYRVSAEAPLRVT